MEHKAFSDALISALPDAIIFHYKPVFEQALESLTDYKAAENLSEDYLSKNDFLDEFCSLVYNNIDASVKSEDIAYKIETITACDQMLIGCLERIEEFADKTGEFATQNKITRRLLQNVMSFILYSLSQIARLNSDLERFLLDKSDEALIPFGFGA
jgi:excinuclease UvrABC helicase subunit UvrB